MQGMPVARRERDSSAAEILVKQLTDRVARMHDLGNKLESIYERLHGPRPGIEGDEAKMPPPSGFFPQLTRATEDLERLLTNALQRADQIAEALEL